VTWEPIAAEKPILSAAERRHLEFIFRGVRHTLLNRGLCRQLQDGGLQEITWRRAILLNDLGIVAFEVDTLRLPIKIEQLLDPEVAHQMQASLSGRKVWSVNSGGLCFCVSLEPEEPKPRVRLPRCVVLDLDARSQGQYLIPVGQGEGDPVWRSLLNTGHILVGGESGSGKSTWLNAMLVALLATHTPQELQVAVVDPKQVEFQVFRGVPHLFSPVATEVDEAAALTTRLLVELDRRRALFAGVLARDLIAYNKVADGLLPLILLIVDEVTDIALQAGLRSAFYKDLIRLVSKGRAFGLVVVLATQNPKAEVLNTLIRGNMSTRVAFRVATVEHSQTILGMGGAQDLPRTIRGRLLARLDGEPIALQAFYVSDEETAALTARLRSEPVPTLTGLERVMVQYAVEELEGKFTIRHLAAAFPDVGEWAVRRLAETWERQGLLAPSENTPDGRTGRRVTDRLLRMALENVEG
jgi:hypothetical protein